MKYSMKQQKINSSADLQFKEQQKSLNDIEQRLNTTSYIGTFRIKTALATQTLLKVFLTEYSPTTPYSRKKNEH